MQVSFIKESLTHYRLRCERADGSVDEASLETRSFLAHDLVHFAFERAARRKDSFFGRISRGGAITARDAFSGEIAATEIVVAPIQSAVKSGRSGAEILAGLAAYAPTQGVLLPPDVTPAQVDGVIDWVRGALRRYDRLKTGDGLLFSFLD